MIYTNQCYNNPHNLTLTLFDLWKKIIKMEEYILKWGDPVTVNYLQKRTREVKTAREPGQRIIARLRSTTIWKRSYLIIQEVIQLRWSYMILHLRKHIFSAKTNLRYLYKENLHSLLFSTAYSSSCKCGFQIFFISWARRICNRNSVLVLAIYSIQL